MSFQVPTYSEYMKATAFAKFKYKYGIIVMVLCWVCLIFICYYMVINGEALASNPLIYGANKMEVECYCKQVSWTFDDNINRVEFFVNSSGIFPSSLKS